MSRTGLGLALLAGLVACSPPQSNAPDGTVRTANGLVRGAEESGQTVFKGVPFAAPPVGDLRWRAPQPAADWEGVLEASAFKPRCVQNGPNYPFAPDEAMSEDCLYLNMWVPAHEAGEKLPVMVWIYGGGFNNGSASDPLYWGDGLAAKGVIVVNLAYRVGSLGFLVHPELSAESGRATSGNYGLMDLVAGLQWVHDNIAAFGGDPNRVTIFGESAGSAAVGYLYVSPLAKGLFSRAIAQSGAPMPPSRTWEGTWSLASAEEDGLDLQATLGVSSLAEMRALPAETVATARGGWPLVDGYIVPDDMYNALKRGEQNDVPLLLGHNDGEGDNLLTEPVSAADYVADMHERFGEFANEMLALYPAGSEEEALRSQRLLLRDSQFGWEMWSWARLQSETGKSPVYEYYFAHVPPWPEGQVFSDWGAAHGNEVFYVMGYPENDWQWTADDDWVLETMSSYWVNFAKSGDPNGEGLPRWEPFTGESQRVIYMRRPFEMRDQPHRESLELIDRHMAKLRADRDQPGWTEPSLAAAAALDAQAPQDAPAPQ